MRGPEQAQALCPIALTRGLSEPRLAAYRLRPNEPFQAVFGRYLWNIALCGSLYQPLHFPEVPLRNSLHRAISRLYGTTAWYERSPMALTPREQDAIRKAKESLVKQRKPEEPDRIVAELSFGFWTSLLSTEYEQTLWPRLLADVFPHMPRRDRTRQNVARRLHAIRQLRNDAFHYAKICTRPGLPELYENILESISWIEPSFPRIRSVGETFHDIFSRGSAAYELIVSF